MRSCGLVVLAIVSACSPAVRKGDPGSGIDAPGIGSGSAGDAPPAVCFEPSVTGTVMTGNAVVQACAIWNNVSRMTGDVTLARTGNDFTMTFANGLGFTGTITGTAVVLTHVEPHTFSDGCGWQSTETLTGTIDPVTCVLALSYAYAEMVTVDNGGCATPCSGTADVTLTITPIIQ